MKNRSLFLSLAAMTPLLSNCQQSVEQKEISQFDSKEFPNVIFIYADDMGKGMLSYYKQKHITTPNIDKIFREGVSFSRSYGCHLSAPARASLLTGYHDCRTNDKWNITRGGLLRFADTSKVAAVEERLDKTNVYLPEGDLYLPQVFKKAGYLTAQIGKLEYGFTATRTQMRAHGWDYYYGYLDHVRCHGYYPPFLFDNDSIALISGNTFTNCAKNDEKDFAGHYEERWDRNGKAQYSQDIFMNKILSYIHKHKNDLFFLYHPTQLPHGPISVPYLDPEVVDNDELSSTEKEYASMIKMLDRNVGEIMRELDELNLSKKTLIIFGADNGHEIYYEHQGTSKRHHANVKTHKTVDDYTEKFYSETCGDIFNGNYSMAGLKRSNLDGGAHVPLAYYWPGHIDGGRICDQLIANYDMIPTFRQLFGMAPLKGKDGVSYARFLLNEKAKPLDLKRCVVNSSFIGCSIVRNDGWKLRYYNKKAQVFELYNLFKDPAEHNNVINENPEIADELRRELYKECTPDYIQSLKGMKKHEHISLVNSTIKN